MKKYLIPMIALLLASCEQNNHAQNPIASQVPTTNAECKNLHKVLDIDDLLYQMYSNMDSHCLFEMPTAELEKIWGIPILDNTNIQAEDKMQKLYQEYEERDFLFLRKHKYNNLDIEVFDIHVGKQYAKKNGGYGGYGGLVGSQIPSFLLNPKIIEHPSNRVPLWQKIHNYIINNQRDNNGYIFGNFYYWNSKKINPMLAIKTNYYFEQGISLHFYYQYHINLLPKFSNLRNSIEPIYSY